MAILLPSYAGGFMAFGWGTDDLSLRQISVDQLRERFAAINLDTKYYNPDLHRGAFALPSYIAERVEAGK
jgi:spermidine synthase